MIEYDYHFAILVNVFDKGCLPELKVFDTVREINGFIKLCFLGCFYLQYNQYELDGCGAIILIVALNSQNVTFLKKTSTNFCKICSSLPERRY